MIVLKVTPLLIISVLVYNIIAFLTGTPFNSVLFQATLPSGADWSFTLGDLIVILTFVLLFIEILKATRTSAKALVDHALSMVVFIICLLEFLMVQSAATSLFFFIMLASAIDVIAGFSVTIVAARRDFALGHGPGGGG